MKVSMSRFVQLSFAVWAELDVASKGHEHYSIASHAVAGM